MRIGTRVVPGLLVVLVGRGALLAGEAEPTPTITILVFNNAPAPHDLLHATESEAERIFSRAGVRVNWCDCSMGHADAASQGTCQEGWGEINIGLRILANPTAPIDRRTLLIDDDYRRGDLLGFAIFPGLASVYYDYRARFDERTLGLHMILGGVIAHEVGHLLLGRGRHSKQGVMQRDWDSRKFDAARLRDLSFSEEESGNIRIEVRRRNAALAARRPLADVNN
jgi:hypothetical protein